MHGYEDACMTDTTANNHGQMHPTMDKRMHACTQPWTQSWTNACTHALNHGPNHGQMHAHMHESTTFCIALQLQPPGLASTTAWQLWQLLSCGSCGSRKGGPLAAVAAANTGSCSSRQRESKPAPPCTGKGKQAWGLCRPVAWLLHVKSQ